MNSRDCLAGLLIVREAVACRGRSCRSVSAAPMAEDMVAFVRSRTVVDLMESLGLPSVGAPVFPLSEFVEGAEPVGVRDTRRVGSFSLSRGSLFAV